MSLNSLEPTVTERRRQTRNKVYQYIYQAQSPVSKAQIAQALELSLPTVHQNLAELLDAGLIVQGEAQKSTGGRPPRGYSAVADVRYAIGISLSAHHLRLLVTDILHHEIASKSINTREVGPEDLDYLVGAELENIIRENQIATEKILGVGVTLPGVIDKERDAVTLSPTLKIRGMSLDRMRKRIPYPLVIENDSTCAGYAEWISQDEEARKRDFVYVLLENGVGGAAFINGRQYLGDNGRSAEFGHMKIEPGGLVCNCGQRGCLEAYTSALRFTRDIHMTLEDFFASLEHGNPENLTLWNDVLSHLATGISNIHMLLDCDIMLGGFVSEFLPPYLDQLKKMAAAMDPFGGSADYIRLARFPRMAAAMGVAWNFVRQFIDEM